MTIIPAIYIVYGYGIYRMAYRLVQKWLSTNGSSKTEL